MTDELGGQSKTLIRGLSILSACAASRRGLTLVEIAEVTELAPSTVHRLLSTLESMKFLSIEPDSGRWRIGVAGFQMGNAFVRSRDYVAQLRPLMVELSELTGETVNLAILSGQKALFVAQVESTNMMRMVAPLGSQSPLHVSGAGKALLAGLSRREREALMNQLDYSQCTEHTLTSADALAVELELVVAEGTAFDREEHVAGMQCIAAPVFNEIGEPLCALSVSGPSVRLIEPVRAECAVAVRAMGGRATEVVGGRPPSHWLAYD